MPSIARAQTCRALRKPAAHELRLVANKVAKKHGSARCRAFLKVGLELSLQSGTDQCA